MIHISRYTPEYRDAFERLNRAWIERYFHLEPSDLHYLSHPEQTIITQGGEIFIALDDGKPVGCCALIRHEDVDGDVRWELAKMAVDEHAQGHGVGLRLGLSLMDYARAIGARRLFLEANTRLEASIHLYRHLGFVPVEDYQAVYERCDLYMEADLTQSRPQPRQEAQRIALLISGGVDSAVATHLLCEQGFRPDLYYIKIGMEGEGMTCTAEEDIELSEATARRYGLPLQVIDLQKEYHDRVVTYVVDRVRRGLTPNPDVMCNRLIKLGAFEEKVGFAYDRIVTGHYAQVLRRDDGIWLAPSPDPVKDQSDFLAQLERYQVEKLWLPIGHLLKEDVRRIAAEAHLPSAARRDSQGICFLGKINYTDFLRQLLGEREGRVIELETGRVVGHHHGYWFHTIGQRKGLGLGGGPWFVVAKDIRRNILYVSHGYDAPRQYGRQFLLAGFHFLTGDPWESAKEMPIRFKIRHTEVPIPGRMTRLEDGRVRIEADTDIQGIAPGQFAVVYTADGILCAGSGEIALDLTKQTPPAIQPGSTLH
jgi:tRNA-specific 2-thiouridylase